VLRSVYTEHDCGLAGICEEMVYIKQTKVIYTEHESEYGTRL